ncbi:MAG: group II intron maturase-specific domain-containing protein [Candidatus Methylomirabilaceae bacterium]
MKKLRAHVVNYADDFVILCRGTASEAREAAGAIIRAMKLALHVEKTRVVNAWREPFDFLGYTFGQCFIPGSSRVYLGARPSKKRVQRFYGAVRQFLDRRNQMEPQVAVERVNSRMLGWAFYYSYGTISRTYKKVDRLVAQSLRAWLRKRHVVPGRGTRRFSDQVLYQQYGLVRLMDVLALRRSQARGESSPRAGCGKSARPVR